MLLPRAGVADQVHGQELATLENHRLDRADENALNIGMREASEPGDERVVLERQLMANAPQLGREDLLQLCWVRLVEKENLVKASPEGPIKKALVVGGSDKNALTSVAVEQLEKGIDDSAKLAMLGGIFALLADVTGSHP